MSGVDGFVQGPADSTGKKIDNDVLTIGADQVYRQRIRLGGFAATALLDIQATDPVGTENGAVVRVAGTVPLPTGAATSAAQTTGNASLSSIDGKLPATLDGSGFLKVHEQGTAATDPIDRAARLLGHVTVDAAPTTAITAVSLPLPSNAAQEASGNLAAIAALLVTEAQVLQVLQLQLAVAKSTHLLLQTAFGADVSVDDAHAELIKGAC